MCVHRLLGPRFPSLVKDCPRLSWYRGTPGGAVPWTVSGRKREAEGADGPSCSCWVLTLPVKEKAFSLRHHIPRQRA